MYTQRKTRRWLHAPHPTSLTSRHAQFITPLHLLTCFIHITNIHQAQRAVQSIGRLALKTQQVLQCISKLRFISSILPWRLQNAFMKQISKTLMSDWSLSSPLANYWRYGNSYQVWKIFRQVTSGSHPGALDCQNQSSKQKGSLRVALRNPQACKA